VEDNDAESACRGMENIACRRCTDAINTRYREERKVVVAVGIFGVAIGDRGGDSSGKKDQRAAANLNRRVSVQRMGMVLRA
jgi:hypothetical protein